MINEYIFEKHFKGLYHNALKKISQADMDYAWELLKHMDEAKFIKKIEQLTNEEKFLTNVKLAFLGRGTQNSNSGNGCAWQGCNLKGSCLHGDKWYCSWHDHCLDDPTRNNRPEFISWVEARLERLDTHSTHDLNDDLHKQDAQCRLYTDEQGKTRYVPIERMCIYCYDSKKVLDIFNWENVSNF